jgi:hypothetical protein
MPVAAPPNVAADVREKPAPHHPTLMGVKVLN